MRIDFRIADLRYRGGESMRGRLFVERALGLLVLFAAPWLRAQTQVKEQFEDLSRRAQAALDSRPEEAIQLYKQALGIRPDWPEGWLYMGGALYQKGRYAEATDALRKGIGLAPIFANGWALLGLCESQLDDPEQALADIRKGEELGLGGNPQFETAVRVRAAHLLIQSSAFDEALAQLQPLTMYPDDPPAAVEAMGLCALASPDDIGRLTPQRRAVVDLAGKAAWALAGQHRDVAATGYRQLLAQYPGEPGVHYAYGIYLMETDIKGALAELQEEVHNHPKHWPSLLGIASIQIRQGAPEQALETLRLALKAVPTSYRWLCHANLGRANLDANNVTAAISELEGAVRQTPSNASAHFFLAEAYRRAGREADAAREKAEFEKTKVQKDSSGVPALHPFGIPEKN
jgi:tetratricopeptide (TPR) repeat protein